ncbi:MAG: carbon-nitrogen hydrolase family protein [Vallitaleaceae bacterium]|jgi:predicted amidohydrolase|nr:carbon-nitrogen hydrolase family protein [Vallitaleaceae bacterium]
MKRCKIAMIQMPVVFDDINRNLRLAEQYIIEAKSNSCDIALLPECLDLGWSNANAYFNAQTIPGASSDYFCNLARVHDIHIVVGLTEKSGVDTYNAALLISDQGKILARHRKINILKDVEGFCSVGNSLSVTTTRFGKIGLAICADNLEETSHLSEALATMGADMILSPSAWAVPPDFDQERTPYGKEWLEPYSKLTTKYYIHIIAVSNVGMIPKGAWKDWLCIGNSIAMGPGGKLLAMLPFGQDAEHIEYIEIDI